MKYKDPFVSMNPFEILAETHQKSSRIHWNPLGLENNIPQTVFTLRGSDGVAFRRGYGSFADPSAAAGGQISL